MKNEALSSSAGADDEMVISLSSVQELSRDYAGYLAVDASKERTAFADSIEEMLTKLDEFNGLVDLVRCDTNLCIHQTVPTIQRKCEEMETIFNRIDKLEAFVTMVKKNVQVMEEHVSKAESEMGSFSGFKKMFSSFVGSKKPTGGDSRTPAYIPPEIFQTEDFLIIPSTPATDTGQSSESGQPASELDSHVTTDQEPEGKEKES